MQTAGTQRPGVLWSATAPMTKPRSRRHRHISVVAPRRDPAQSPADLVVDPAGSVIALQSWKDASFGSGTKAADVTYCCSAATRRN